MFEGLLRATRGFVPQDCIPRAQSLDRPTTRCNYSKDFLILVGGVSLILSRVYASALHLIASLHLHKERSTAPLTWPSFPASLCNFTRSSSSSETISQSILYVSHDQVFACNNLPPSQYIGIIDGQGVIDIPLLSLWISNLI